MQGSQSQIALGTIVEVLWCAPIRYSGDLLDLFKQVTSSVRHKGSLVFSECSPINLSEFNESSPRANIP